MQQATSQIILVKNKWKWMALASVALFAAMVVISGCTKKTNPAETILIGEVGSMTGDNATFGISTHNGIVMALKEINAAGGVKGKQVEVRSLDDQGKPEEAAIAITKLINQDKVIAVLGEVASSRTLAMAPIAQKNKIPLLTPASTNPKVTEAGDYVFRSCFIDPFQGTVMAKFARENLKFSKVAILRDVKNDYSIGLADFFIEAFKKAGGEIVADSSYASGDLDFKAQLTAIKGKNPDAIYVPGYYTEVGLIARQARELGIKSPLMGGDGWDSPKLFEIGGDAIVGSFISNHYAADDQSPIIQTFIKKYTDAYGAVPDAMGALAYDATYMLVDAMKSLETITPEGIRNALAKTKDFKGVTGTMTLDEKRNPTKSAVLLRVEKTGFKYQATVNP